MQSAMRIQTKVLPGHRIEVCAPDLPEGDMVEVIVLLKEREAAVAQPKQSMLEYFNAQAGQPRLFATPADADRYLQGERDSWER